MFLKNTTNSLILVLIYRNSFNKRERYSRVVKTEKVSIICSDIYIILSVDQYLIFNLFNVYDKDFKHNGVRV